MLVEIVALPLEITGAVGPAFITSLAALVTSIALLLGALPKLRRIERQTNGNVERLEHRVRELRDENDQLRLDLSHSRRTNAALLEREGK